MLNISFCSASLSLRTVSLISPLPLQPELYPEGLREALTLLATGSFRTNPSPQPELGARQCHRQWA